MPPIDRRIKIGTLVKPVGHPKLVPVEAVHPTREWVILKNIKGRFTMGHIERFRNISKPIPITPIRIDTSLKERCRQAATAEGVSCVGTWIKQVVEQRLQELEL